METKISIMSEAVTITLAYVARDMMLHPQSMYVEIIKRPSVATLSRLKEINSVVVKSRSGHT
jgi:hypothetical protein